MKQLKRVWKKKKCSFHIKKHNDYYKANLVAATVENIAETVGEIIIIQTNVGIRNVMRIQVSETNKQKTLDTKQTEILWLLQEDKPHIGGVLQKEKRRHKKGESRYAKPTDYVGKWQRIGRGGHPSGLRTKNNSPKSRILTFKMKLTNNYATYNIPQCIKESAKLLIDTGVDLNLIKLSSLKDG